jgi:hypothetical protein
MKNILLKSIQVFALMTILNTISADWSVGFLRLPGGDFGMLSLAVLIGCCIISGISFITVLIFKHHYHSIFRIALLFEILYILTLAFTGTNPFTFFHEQNNAKLLNVLLYLNSIVIFLAVWLLGVLLSKINFKKAKN